MELNGFLYQKEKLGRNILEIGKKIEKQVEEHNFFKMEIDMMVIGLMIYPMEKEE